MGPSAALKVEIQTRGGIVIVCLSGSLEYEETNQAIAAAVDAAGVGGTSRILFDMRRADLANYYSYTVRHAEVAPQLGLHTGFVLGFVGPRAAQDVLCFMENVARNRGWKARSFTSMVDAFKWLKA